MWTEDLASSFLVSIWVLGADMCSRAFSLPLQARSNRERLRDVVCYGELQDTSNCNVLERNTISDTYPHTLLRENRAWRWTKSSLEKISKFSFLQRNSVKRCVGYGLCFGAKTKYIFFVFFKTKFLILTLYQYVCTLYDKSALISVHNRCIIQRLHHSMKGIKNNANNAIRSMFTVVKNAW